VRFDARVGIVTSIEMSERNFIITRESMDSISLVAGERPNLRNLPLPCIKLYIDEKT